MYKHKFPEEIETPRLFLRKNRLEWAPSIFTAVESDREHLRQFLPWVDFTATVEEEYAYLHQVQTQWELCEVFDYSLFLREGDEFVGSIGLHNISWHGGGGGELGYWILSKFGNQGLATEATRAMCDLAFAREFRRLEIRCTEDNLRSARLAARLGFTREARLRESSANLGRVRDVLVYAVLKADWNNIRFVGPGWIALVEGLDNFPGLEVTFKKLGLNFARDEFGRRTCVRRFLSEDQISMWRNTLTEIQLADRDFAAAWTRAQITFARVEIPVDLPTRS